MPRQRILHRRRTDDFPERLRRFQEESGLERRSRRASFSRSRSSAFLILSTSIQVGTAAIPLVLGGPAASS